jgi:hypothetical protein
LAFSAHFVSEHHPILVEHGGERRRGRRIGGMFAERIVEGNVTSPTLRNKATPHDNWSASHLAR